MIILVTGSSGFIGRTLCFQLSRSGATLRIVSRNHIIRHNNWEQIKIPAINAATDWREALHSVDRVVHLAAHVHVMKSGADDKKTFWEVNVEGTRRLAEAAATTGVRRFIFMSTVKVHGERTLGVPFSEEMLPAPEDLYSRSKAEAEDILKRVGTSSGMEIVIVRPPLVYGPGVKANFYQLLKLIHRRVPLPLGAVNNKRSLIFLDNLVDAIMTCLTHPAAANETFLVSDREDLSTADIVRLIARAMDVQVLLPSLPPSLLRLGGELLGKGDMIGRITDSLQIDSSHIQTHLGWTPPHTVEEGLRKTVQWFLEKQGNASGK